MYKKRLVFIVFLTLLCVSCAFAFWNFNDKEKTWGREVVISVNEAGKVSVVRAAAEPSYSGIENIYFMNSSAGYDNSENLSGHENILEMDGTDVVMTGQDSFTSPLPYDKAFDIVPAVKVHDDNVPYLNTDNIKVELEVKGDLTIGPENKSGNELENFIVTGNYLRCNAIWNNGGSGYSIRADESITIKITLWAYGFH